MQALESIQREQVSGGSELYSEAPPPPNVRRPIAIYQAARAIIGAITPYYDEVSKVIYPSQAPRAECIFRSGTILACHCCAEYTWKRSEPSLLLCWMM
jgi:hypothetical protein